MKSRPLFLKCFLIQVLAALAVGFLTYFYADRVQGSSLFVIPVIFAVYIGATAYGMRLTWIVSGGEYDRKDILHRASFLSFWAWTCQMLGIMATIWGFWLLLSGDDSNLAAKIKEGGGVALMGTFIGVGASLLISLQERLIEHEAA